MGGAYDQGGGPRRQPLTTAAIPLAAVFVSGACALIYELSWLRLFASVFGVGIYATGAVIATTMAGMALGSYVVGRHIHRVASPLRGYAMLELATGVSALGVPWVTRSLDSVYSAGLIAAGSREPAVLALQLALTAITLLVPAALIGGTVPALIGHLSSRPEHAGPAAGRLYALGTAGGVLGVLATGLWLLPAYGVEQTNTIAAGSSAVLGAGILGLRPRASSGQPVFVSVPRPWPTPGDRLLLLAIAGSGFVGLAHEIAWMRALAILTQDTAFTQACGLGVFLAGLALGSQLSRLVSTTRRRMETCLIAAQLLVATLVISSPALLEFFHSNFGPLVGGAASSTMGSGAHAYRPAVAAVIALGPAAIALGASVPLAIGIDAHSTRAPSYSAGRVYAANTGGAIAGSIAVSLWLIPRLGTWGTINTVAVVSVGAAVTVAYAGTWLETSTRRQRVVTIGAIMATLIVLFAGRSRPDDPLFPRYDHPGRVVYRAEDASGLVEVIEAPSGARVLLADRQHSWGTTGAPMIRSMYRQGYLPLLLHPRPQSVLELGLATGINLAPAVVDDAVESLTVVEISPAIVSAADYFGEFNRGVVHHGKTEVVIADGRAFLLADEGRYDVIVIGLLTPYRPGAAYLFSREFYELCRGRVNPGGLFIQWLPLDQLTPAALRSTIRTIVGTFEHVVAFEKDHYLAVVTGEPVRALDFSQIERRIADPAIHEDLIDIGWVDAYQVLGSYLMGREALELFADGAPANVYDRPTVEYSGELAPHAKRYEFAANNLEALLGHKQDVSEGVVHIPDLVHARAIAGARGHVLRGGLSQVRAEHRAAIRHFERALELDPHESTARAALFGYQSAAGL